MLLPTNLTLYLDCLRDKSLLIYDGAMPCAALKVNNFENYSEFHREPVEVYHDWSDMGVGWRVCKKSRSCVLYAL